MGIKDFAFLRSYFFISEALQKTKPMVKIYYLFGTPAELQCHCGGYLQPYSPVVANTSTRVGSR
jgi:hypothetical protein